MRPCSFQSWVRCSGLSQLGLVDIQDMTADAAVVAVVISLMVGYYFARWRRSEASLKSARALTDGAGKAAWRARWAILFVALALWVVVDMWFRGKGRLLRTRAAPLSLCAVRRLSSAPLGK
jgi:hypothetical protein